MQLLFVIRKILTIPGCIVHLLTCKRSCSNAYNIICIGTCPIATVTEESFMTMYKSPWFTHIVYAVDIAPSVPWIPHNHWSNLLRVIWNRVAVGGSGQQKASAKSTFKKAMSLSNVNTPAMVVVRIFAEAGERISCCNSLTQPYILPTRDFPFRNSQEKKNTRGEPGGTPAYWINYL